MYDPSMCKEIKRLPKFYLLQNPASVFYVNLQECYKKDKRKRITNNQNVIYVMRKKGRLPLCLMITGYICFNYYDKVK